MQRLFWLVIYKIYYVNDILEILLNSMLDYINIYTLNVVVLRLIKKLNELSAINQYMRTLFCSDRLALCAYTGAHDCEFCFLSQLIVLHWSNRHTLMSEYSSCGIFM